MLFSSPFFLFAFLPLVLILNRWLPLKWSNVFLLFSSLLFYYIGEGTLTLLLLINISWNFLFGIWIEKGSKLRSFILGMGLMGNLGLLIYYKYTGFFIEALGLEEWVSTFEYHSIILPIGISFFTFQGMSYLIDVYRKVEPASNNPIRLGLYISFFPQLIAGPIIKYKEIAKYLAQRKIDSEGLSEGGLRFIRGLFKKIVIADGLSFISDALFASEYESLPSSLAWIGLASYSLQIYFDFSGYSDMAIGLGRMMGFKIPENFNYPYISRSIREFWRRWHISLSTWFRDYLYIPLGGNQKGSGRTYFHLLIVFFITGLWHGANFNFVLWGMFHGLFLILERLPFFRRMKSPRIFQHTYVLLVSCLAWVFFRTENLDSALAFFKALFGLSLASDWSIYSLISNYHFFLLAIAVLLALPRTKMLADFKLKCGTLAAPIEYGLHLALFFYCLFEISSSNHQAFIYFKF